MKKVIYPGTFDPITYGHIDLIKKALNIFDNLKSKIPGYNPLTTDKALLSLVPTYIYKNHESVGSGTLRSNCFG